MSHGTIGDSAERAGEYMACAASLQSCKGSNTCSCSVPRVLTGGKRLSAWWLIHRGACQLAQQKG